MPTNFDAEEIKGFAYLDADNIVASWNIARGSFCSPMELQGFYSLDFKNILSISMFGLLSNGSPNRLNSELEIEKIRKKYFSDCVSRLTGFFIFDEIESINQFKERESWGGHFSDEYLSDVSVASTRSTRVDSN